MEFNLSEMTAKEWNRVGTGDKIIMDEDACFLSGGRTSNYLDFEVMGVITTGSFHEKIYIGRFDKEPGKSFWTPGGIALTIDMALNWKQFVSEKLNIDLNVIRDDVVKAIGYSEWNQKKGRILEQICMVFPHNSLEWSESVAQFIVMAFPFTSIKMEIDTENHEFKSATVTYKV